MDEPSHAAPDAESDGSHDLVDVTPAETDVTIALTPPQLAVVVVVIALIAVWLIRRRRRGA